MLMRHAARPLALVLAAGVAALGACTNSGSEQEGTNQAPAVSGRDGPATDENPVGNAPNQAGQTQAEPAGAIGPGGTAQTSNVDPNTQSTHTQVDSTPQRRPNAGPGHQ
jgi:hypothetical protein